MLHLLDITFYAIHITIILYCLFGWVFRRFRRAHLVFIGVIAGCWIGLGLWYGMGYCPLTDWHWQVKQKLSEKELPPSFIKHVWDNVSPVPISDSAADVLTVTGFFGAVVISIYLNVIKGIHRDRDGSPESVRSAD